MEIQDLLNKVIEQNIDELSELLFNLYENEKFYTMEAVLDDDKIIIGRENPAIICGVNREYEKVLKEIEVTLKAFYNQNKHQLKNLEEISYGFVDGDLLYIKRSRNQKREKKIKKFTEEDFKDFSIFKLHCWITVYVDKEKQEEFNLPIFAPESASEEECNRYRHFLVDNFNYEKYFKQK